MFIKRFIIVVFVIFAWSSLCGTEHDVDSLTVALRNTDMPSDKITILNLLAKVYADNDPIRSENYASQALFIAESIENEAGKAEAYYNLGILAYQKNQYTQSMEYFRKSEEGFEKLNDDKWLAKVYLYLSRHYKHNLEYEKAIRHLYKAMDTFKKLNKEKKLAETYNAIGGNYYDQGNYERAYEYYEKSLNLYIQLNDRKGMGALYNNLGEIYRINKDYSKAIEYYNNSLEIYQAYNLSEELAAIYNNIGMVYFELKDLDSTKYYLTLGKELSDYTRIASRMSSVRVSLGKYYMAVDNREKADEVLQQGYALAVKNADIRNIIAASEALSDLYLKENNFEKAYQYFIQFRTNADSLYNKSNMEKITQLEMNLLFDLENEMQEAQIQRTNLRYFTIAIILISLITIVVLLYGRQRIKIKQAGIHADNLQMERVRLQEEIDYKNRELATNVMYLVKKNELINFITEKLFKAKSYFKPTIRKTVEDILLHLQSNSDENIWKVFEDRFREVHKDFYENLLKDYPKLTDNDRKLCAFIRLNMNTKEIAAITHQNPNSIEVARTRLRKKLDISNKDISLNGFLSNL